MDDSEGPAEPGGGATGCLGLCVVKERLPRVCSPVPATPPVALTLRTSMHCWQEQGWPSAVTGTAPLG